MESNFHVSVLLNEAIAALNIKPNGVYVDCTLGRGGHAEAILAKLDHSGLLICFDQDQTAVDFAKEKFANDQRIIIIKTNFKHLKQKLNELNIDTVDGFLFDLGLSSPQLDNPNRGFSYVHNAILDMRMDQSQSFSAHHIINNYTAAQLMTIFRRYGEIKYPQKVVQAIIKQRALTPINTTHELVEIIKLNSHYFQTSKHSARLYFQALRIAVNDELNILAPSLQAAIEKLAVLGRIVVISFHSLEDQITKQTFSLYTKNQLPKEVPLVDFVPKYSLVHNKIKPSAEEKAINNRARSSIMRALVRNY